MNAIKRFKEIVQPKIEAMEMGIRIVRGGRGFLAKEVADLDDVRWTDRCQDADRYTTKKPRFASEYGRIKTATIWKLFFDLSSVAEWSIFKMPLQTDADVHNFDLEVLRLIQFQNRSEMMPNCYIIQKHRERGEMKGFHTTTVNGEKLTHRSMDFILVIKLVPIIEKMKIHLTDIQIM